MTEDEARRILGTSPGSRSAQIDDAFRQLRQKYVKPQKALVPKERDDDTKAVRLIQDAYFKLTGRTKPRGKAPARRAASPIPKTSFNSSPARTRQRTPKPARPSPPSPSPAQGRPAAYRTKSSQGGFVHRVEKVSQWVRDLFGNIASHVLDWIDQQVTLERIGPPAIIFAFAALVVIMIVSASPSPSPSADTPTAHPQAAPQTDAAIPPVVAAKPEPTAPLIVKTTPWSRVTLDGAYLGDAPWLKPVRVPLGQHRLEMTANDGRTLSRTLNLTSSRVIQVKGNFRAGKVSESVVIHHEK